MKNGDGDFPTLPPMRWTAIPHVASCDAALLLMHPGIFGSSKL